MRFFVPGYFKSVASDTAVIVITKSLLDLIDRTNTALKGLHTFLTLSKLAVNASKTNYMVFRRTGEPHDLPSNVKYNGVSLKQVRQMRYVGFLLDFKLSWKAHSNLVSCKVSRGV